MRYPAIAVAVMATVGVLSGCDNAVDSTAAELGTRGVNVIDESNLNDVMLTVGDPNEAASYFQRTLNEDPDRIDLRRGLALSLVRARRIPEASAAWASVVEHPDARDDDRVMLADTLIRAGDWDAAEAILRDVPPTHETYRRYRLEAMVADSKEDWDRADSFYEIAAGLTDQPAAVLNNWGFSKLTRGDNAEAERLFQDAIRLQPDLFTAKNNLVMARGGRGNYTMPVIPVTQIERAQLLHTLGILAVRRGDVAIGQGLLEDAVDTHPQHFEAAARALSALENGG